MVPKPQALNNADGHSSSSAGSPATKDALGTATATSTATASSRKASPLPSINGSGPFSTLLPRMSDPPPGNISTSRAIMEKTETANSNRGSPHPPAKDVVTAEKVSPYGTRSRNRNGASRPNYAEDKDIDMELFDLYPEKRDAESKKTNRPTATSTSSTNTPQPTPPAGPRSSTAPPARKPLPTEADSKHSHHSHASHAARGSPTSRASSHAPSHASSHNGGTRDHHSLASTTMTLTPAATAKTAGSSTSHSSSNSKKRKAASQATSNSSNNNSQVQAASAPPSISASTTNVHSKTITATNINPNTKTTTTTVAKRITVTVNRGTGYAETNMLSFEDCKSTPVDGKMVADDGTILEVNG
jgi:hypothetical protein